MVKDAPVHDPGPAEARRRADAVASRAGTAIPAGKGHQMRYGTAGWTDPTLTASGVFYPKGADSAEDRLRYYSSLFPLVEIDSTYYSLPIRRNAELWLERTPPDFVFDLKAHAIMTGQPTEVNRLPRMIRDAIPEEKAGGRIYGKDLPAEAYDEVWATFREAIAPLHDAGRLGAVLLQYPRWILPSSENRDAIVEAQERLEPLPCSIEFRNAAWFSEKNAERTLHFLEDHHLPFVMVDEPQGLSSSVPPVVAVTSSDLAIVRFHGRRKETWEARGVGVAERFRYLYDRGELSEWTPRIMEAATQAQQVHVIMNNCYGNYGTTNALEIADLLRAAG